MIFKEMTLIENHLEKYFHSKTYLVLHQTNESEYHIDCLLFKPTEEYPFWKLVTMGASDYEMPKGHCVELRNEYIMFVDKKEDLNDKSILDYYYNQLVNIANYPIINKTLLTYGHDICWETEDEMCGAYINFPTIISDPDILRLKLGFFKKIAFLEVVLLTKEDMKLLNKIGYVEFSYYLSPEDESKVHYLSQKNRTDAF